MLVAISRPPRAYPEERLEPFGVAALLSANLQPGLRERAVHDLRDQVASRLGEERASLAARAEIVGVEVPAVADPLLERADLVDQSKPLGFRAEPYLARPHVRSAGQSLAPQSSDLADEYLPDLLN